MGNAFLQRSLTEFYKERNSFTDSEYIQNHAQMLATYVHTLLLTCMDYLFCLRLFSSDFGYFQQVTATTYAYRLLWVRSMEEQYIIEDESYEFILGCKKRLHRRSKAQQVWLYCFLKHSLNLNRLNEQQDNRIWLQGILLNCLQGLDKCSVSLRARNIF